MRVYVGGTFDLFHAGHVELLRTAAKYGEVWVALNTDEYASSFKKAPIMTTEERSEVIGSCGWVYAVALIDGDERDWLDFIAPDFIVYAPKPGEYTRASYLERLKIDEDYLKANGIELIFLEYTQGVSSSDVVERVLQRDRSQSRQCCGAAEDAGQPDVPIAPCDRDGCSCERDCPCCFAGA